MGQTLRHRVRCGTRACPPNSVGSPGLGCPYPRDASLLSAPQSRLLVVWGTPDPTSRTPKPPRPVPAFTAPRVSPRALRLAPPPRRRRCLLPLAPQLEPRPPRFSRLFPAPSARLHQSTPGSSFDQSPAPSQPILPRAAPERRGCGVLLPNYPDGIQSRPPRQPIGAREIRRG